MKLSFDKRTVQLATSYLGVMFAVSIVFSVIFYITSASALHVATYQHQAPLMSHGGDQVLPGLPSPTAAIQDQASLIKRRLFVQLSLLNVGTLLIGMGLSYYLARRSLRPMEQAMDMQQQFVSNASHELKTPLSALRLRGEVALRNPELALDEAKATIASNVEQAQKLERLSRDLLRLARVRFVAPDLKLISLKNVALDAVGQIMASAEAKSVSIVTAVPEISVQSDEQQLTQVIVILLDNAVKYSARGSSVYLEAKREGKDIVIRVRDEGPGIATTDLPHIFERFYQGDQSRQREGSGLGLSIADAIVRQLHGSIHVESSPRGSTFSVHITAK